MTTKTDVQHGLDIDEVLQHYIEAALWSSNDESDESGGEPFDANYSADDVAPETLAKMREDVVKFVAKGHVELRTWKGRTTVEQQAGHDFWLNRNGHGCGFWESEWGKPGERLDKVAKSFGEVYLYLGDDGKIYCD